MGYVPNENATEVESVLEYFSIPELAIKRDQVEFRTMDHTHMLTNMRNHILTYGYEYCKKEHFVHLADNRPNILSHAFVCDKVDTQNAFFAMKMFSHPVEDYMRDEGFNETVDFVQLVRHWHSACNMRGISVDERIWKLYDMHEFLAQDVNLDHFPLKYTRYICGMPVQTYKAILQNISMRLQLYKFAFDGCYNVHAVSTLSNESFFSDLTCLDKEQ